MGEKVIFSFRVERSDASVQYEINHPEQGISARFVAPDRHNSTLKSWRPARYAKRKKMKINANMRKEMRRRLEFYRQVYDDLYKGE